MIIENRPYVYKITHRITRQYYVGVRCANKDPYWDDFGVHYFTSSKYVKELGFDNFILDKCFEFDSAEQAYRYEQYYIEMLINDCLCLNKMYVDQNNMKRFVYGEKSEQTKERMRKPKTLQHRLNISKSKTGKKINRNYNQICGMKGKTHSAEKRKLMSFPGELNASYGKRWITNGIINEYLKTDETFIMPNGWRFGATQKRKNS